MSMRSKDRSSKQKLKLQRISDMLHLPWQLGVVGFVLNILEVVDWFVEFESSSNVAGNAVIMLVWRTLFVPLSGANGGTGSQFTSFLLSMIVVGMIFGLPPFILVVCWMVGVLITIVPFASLFRLILTDEFAAAN